MMELNQIFFKINQNIINRFRELEDDMEFGKYDRFFQLLTIFDKNDDKKLNPDEVNTVFSMVLNESEKVGDDFILTEKIADKIVENAPTLKKNKISGREFVFFIQKLFAKMGTRARCDEDRYSNGNLRSKDTERGRITYYEDGTVQEEYDKELNKCTRYYPNGKISSIELGEWGNSSLTRYYLSGKVYKVRNADNSSMTYYENGQIKEQQSKDGSYTQYYENGRIKAQENVEARTTEEYYSNGQLKSRFCLIGHREEEYYENGQLKYILNPKDDSADLERSYYENGVLKERCFKDDSGYHIIKYDEQGNIVLNSEFDKKEEFKKRLLDIASFDSEEDKINLIKELNKDNIIEFIDSSQFSWSKLISTINNENTQKQIFSYLENVLKERFEAGLENIKSPVQIKNKYHEGDEYKVKWKGEKIYITNTNTKEKSVIDTQKLVQNFPKAMQYWFLIRLQNLPGEVLMDMANEADYTDIAVSSTADGSYNTDNDMINLLDGTFSTGTIVHELGHALDNIFQNNKFSSETSEILSSFEEENMKYGGGSSNLSDYCTSNVREFFAEAYTLMMLGEDYRAAKTIENNFPRTFALLKDLLEEIRRLPKEYRHRQDIR